MLIAELDNQDLDWAVAVACGIHLDCDIYRGNIWHCPGESDLIRYQPSVDRNQSGEIIDREKIKTYWHISMGMWCGECNGFRCYGETPSIAAMRSFAQSKLGMYNHILIGENNEQN